MSIATPSPTVTPLHRLAAVLRLLDGMPSWATHAEIDHVRALIVGDLDRPAYVALPAAEAAWLRSVAQAAEVVTWGPTEPGQLAGLHDIIRQRPDGGA